MFKEDLPLNNQTKVFRPENLTNWPRIRKTLNSNLLTSAKRIGLVSHPGRAEGLVCMYVCIYYVFKTREECLHRKFFSC